MTRSTRFSFVCTLQYYPPLPQSILPTVSPHRPLLWLLVLVVLLARDNKVTGDGSMLLCCCCAAVLREYARVFMAEWLWLGYTGIPLLLISL